MSRSRFSTAGLVIILLVSATTVLLVTMAIVGYSSYRTRQREDFAREHAVLANQLSISLTLPLWNFDRGQIGKIIEGAMQDEDIYGIVARSAGADPVQYVRTRDDDWKVMTATGNLTAGDLQIEKRAISMAGETIGEVDVFATPKFLEARLRQTLYSVIGAIGLLNLSLIVGLYFLLWRIVLRPLREVERHALALSSGDQAVVPLRPDRYSRELASLCRSLEKMIGMLAARLQEVQRSEARHRQLAETLRESEEKFSTAFRSSPDAMAIAEMTTGRYLEVNDGFEHLFGLSRADVLGRTSIELRIWPDEAARNRFVEQLRAKRKVRGVEVNNFNRRGEAITYLLSAESMVLGGQNCIVSALHDITDRKHAEDESARAAARERAARDDFTRRLIVSQEAERRRIAGELHDSLGQNLLLIRNRTQLALTTTEVPDELRWQFESIREMAAQAITEVRQISHDLRPYQLDQLGLTRALEAMIDSAARNSGFSFTRKLDPVDDLFAAEAATNLYRVIQECLSNILRHAHATHASITLERDVRHVRLEIKDDGRGFAPGAPAPSKEGGFGLRNLAERVRILGGSLAIDSGLDRGTCLVVTIPVPEAA